MPATFRDEGSALVLSAAGSPLDEEPRVRGVER
jgi:hypothetical protein